jgi:hypothetical protein
MNYVQNCIIPNCINQSYYRLIDSNNGSIPICEDCATKLAASKLLKPFKQTIFLSIKDPEFQRKLQNFLNDLK